jgi:hypothetical protein
MTTMELVKQDAGALEAQEVAAKIQTALAAGRTALWELAEALHAFDEMRGWRDLGYATLSAWLEDTDEQITRGTYYRLVGTWRKLVIEQNIDADRVRCLDQSKVAIVADRIRDDEVKIDVALADVEALGAQDLREKYGPAKREAPSSAPVKPEPACDPPDEFGGPSSDTRKDEAGAVCPMCGRPVEEEV